MSPEITTKKSLNLPSNAGEVSAEFYEEVEQSQNLEILIERKIQEIKILQQIIRTGEKPQPADQNKFTRKNGIRQEFMRIWKEEDPRDQWRLITQLIHVYLNLLFNELAYLKYKTQEQSITGEVRDKALTGPSAELWATNEFPSIQKEFDEMCKLSKISEETQSIMDEFGTAVEAKVQVDGILFYVGKIRQYKPQIGGNRLECLFYSLKDGVLKPRLAYKSSSGSEWRISPILTGNKYFKGIHSYTSENKPCIELEQIFYTLESKFDPKTPCEKRLRTSQDFEAYQKEIRKGKTPKGLERICEHKQGFGFRNWAYDKDIFDPKHIPDTFIPDFKQVPKRVLRRQSEFRGNITLELYQMTHEGHTYNVWQGIDADGYAQPERIIPTNARVNSYGLYEEVCDLGILSEKPADYLDQIDGLNIEGDDENPRDNRRPIEAIVIKENPMYADIRRTLAQLKFNQAYYRAKGMNGENRLPLKPGNTSLAHQDLRRIDMGYPQNMEGVLQQFIQERLPLLPSINKLITALTQNDQRKEARLMLNLLENPQPISSVVLRSLLQLIQISHLSSEALKQCLDIILEKFSNGFPPEKALYLALCREILKRWEGQGPQTQFGEVKTYLEPQEPKPAPKKRMPESEKVEFTRYQARCKVLQFMETIGDWPQAA